MTFAAYRAKFDAAGGCLLIRDEAWLRRHFDAGRPAAETAALTRRVPGHSFDAFVAAVEARALAQQARQLFQGAP